MTYTYQTLKLLANGKGLDDTAERMPADNALKRDALLHVLAGAGVTVATGAAVRYWLGMPADGVAIAAAAFVGFIGFLLIWLREHAPHRKLGTANRITILRAAIVANIAAMTFYPSVVELNGWAVTALMIAAFALDGMDGRAARRFALVSRFGARLDQELDAVFTLVLAFAVFQLGNAGWWILIAGAWHYVFHALRSLSPTFRQSLPFSQRRRAVCAITVGALIAFASPLLQPPASEMAALVTVTLLSVSFLIDIVWLLRLRPGAK
jgi:phosphatidylglycerophosphate synthase